MRISRISTYVGNDPVNGRDTTGMWRDIYIGGAADRRTGIVKSYAAREARQHPQRDVKYFDWLQVSEIREAIRTTLPEAPLNIIGHSLGGAEAIRQADATDRQVDTLITIDAVDLPANSVSSELTLQNVGTWANVTANPGEWDRSDVIAAAGGKVDPAVTGQADLNVSSPHHHGQFEEMMKQIKADRAIDSTYKRR
jgi:pimeloyl-ACP methyl ester carboxylesterase